MKDMSKYYIVEAHVLPEIAIKVLKAKQLLDEGRVKFVSDAVKAVGVSRSAYYKYHDSIQPFFEYEEHRTVTLGVSLVDNPGVLGHVLKSLAQFELNVLTINQTIPINRVANVTITFETLGSSVNIDEVIKSFNEFDDVIEVNLLARE